MLIKILRFIVGLALLFLMLYLGRLVNQLFPIGIPESIWGLLILFSLLLTNILKIQWVSPASRPILRYMTLFFLPICSGIIEQMDMLHQHLNALILANFLSAVLSLVLIGYLAQWLFSQEQKQEHVDE
ncbi:CidA/LrgA family protein [Frederiksenia canicola]